MSLSQVLRARDLTLLLCPSRSRWGYTSVVELQEVVENYTAASIPLEGAWTDIDFMDAFKVRGDAG